MQRFSCKIQRRAVWQLFSAVLTIDHFLANRVWKNTLLGVQANLIVLLFLCVLLLNSPSALSVHYCGHNKVSLAHFTEHIPEKIFYEDLIIIEMLRMQCALSPSCIPPQHDSFFFFSKMVNWVSWILSMLTLGCKQRNRKIRTPYGNFTCWTAHPVFLFFCHQKQEWVSFIQDAFE